MISPLEGEMSAKPTEGGDRARGSLIPQFRCQTGVDQYLAGLVGLILGHQETPRQKAERTLKDTHALVGDETADTGVLHQAFRKGKHDDIIGTDQFLHYGSFSCLI